VPFLLPHPLHLRLASSRAPLPQRLGDLPCRSPELAGLLVVVGERVEDQDRLALRRPVVQAEDREAADRLVVVVARELVQARANVVDEAWMVTGKELERDERRAATGRALVLEAPAQQLGLLPIAKLTDRAIGDCPLTVVGRPGETFDLVLPARSKPGELLLLTALGQGGRFGSG
jgi:hypothetical protein